MDTEVRSAFDELARTVREIRDTQSEDTVHDALETKITSIEEGLREVRRAQVAGVANRAGEARVESGLYAGCDAFDLRLSHAVLRMAMDSPESVRRVRPEVADRWRANLADARRDLLAVEGRALAPGNPGEGAELTFDGLSSMMWRDVHLATAVASLFPMIQMPTATFRIPHDFGDVTWYRSTANVAGTASTVTTARATLEAVGIKAIVNWSYDLDEESVVAVMPELRATLVRNAAEVMDDLVLNGDTTDAGANVNFDGGAAGGISGTAGYDHYLAFDGLIKRALIDNANQAVNVNAAIDAATFNNVRAKMGRYGVRPAGMAYVMDISTYIKALGISDFTTLEKFGPAATLLTGQLGAVEGVPIIVSEQMKLAAADGKVTHNAVGTTGRLVAVNRSQFIKGYLRDVLIESERDIQKQETVMVVSFRMAFTGRNAATGDTAVAIGRNITL